MAYLKDVVAALRDSGVPTIQTRFPTDRKPPYAVVLRNGESLLASDDRPLSEYEIVLYTKERDMTLEFAIEDALADLHVTFVKGATGIDGETDLHSIPFTDIDVYER